MSPARDLIGCHVSTAGGLHQAPARADELGASVMQIFTANQRTWKAPALSDEQVSAFREALDASSVSVVMSHDSYLINLANPTEEMRARSMAAFLAEYERCTRLGIPLLNFHPGAHLGEGEERAIALVADGMKRTLDALPDSGTMLVVEATAGQGTNLGHRLEHLAAILEAVSAPERTGVCIDTQHVFAAGYDLKSERGYLAFFKQLDQLVGLDRLVGFHVNDSKTALASRVDRHEELGKGELGKTALARLARDKRFFKVPMFLETPDDERYAAEIKLLRKWRSTKE